jgi:small subunit ribosomal protein S15
MALTAEVKKASIEKFGTSANDTGSARVQIAMLTDRINQLTEHLKLNVKDQSSRRGLLKLVGQRRRLLNYIMNRHLDEYRKLIQDLGIRK